MMKRFVLALSLAVLSLSTLVPQGVEAKRLGGGGSMGMKRTTPPPRTPPAANNPAPAPAATPNAAAPTPPAATPPKRSWMGPLAGLAAGLGLAALASHLGLGAGFGNILMMVLLAGVAFIVIRMVMRRFAPQPAQGLQFAGAGAGSGPSWSPAAQAGNWSHPNSGAGEAPAMAQLPAAAAAAPTAPNVPADFDVAAFERTAKLIFIRLQAANDVADLNDLRSFTTPEMFAAVKLDLQERGSKSQQTDVVKLDAELLEATEEASQRVVSVRFHGLIREEVGGAATPFDEVWHLVRPLDGSREWAIAGIAQTA